MINTVTWASQSAEYGPDIVGTLDIQGPGWQTEDVMTFVEKAAAKEVLAEVFGVGISDVEEVILTRYDEIGYGNPGNEETEQ